MSAALGLYTRIGDPGPASSLALPVRAYRVCCSLPRRDCICEAGIASHAEWASGRSSKADSGFKPDALADHTVRAACANRYFGLVQFLRWAEARPVLPSLVRDQNAICRSHFGFGNLVGGFTLRRYGDRRQTQEPFTERYHLRTDCRWHLGISAKPDATRPVSRI